MVQKIQDIGRYKVKYSALKLLKLLIVLTCIAETNPLKAWVSPNFLPFMFNPGRLAPLRDPLPVGRILIPTCSDSSCSSIIETTCGAARISPNYIVTAAHCIYEPFIAARMNIVLENLVYEQLPASSFSTTRIHILPDRPNSRWIDTTSRMFARNIRFDSRHSTRYDWILLPIENNPSLGTAYLRIAEVHPRQQIYLAGNFPNLSGNILGDVCNAISVNPTFGDFLHNCNSQAETSGSPILTRTPSGEYVLVGIHGGEQAPGTGSGNLGTNSSWFRQTVAEVMRSHSR